MNQDTNLPFTRLDWYEFIEKFEEKRTGVLPTVEWVIDRQEAIFKVQRQIPTWIWDELKKDYTTVPKADKLVYLCRGKIQNGQHES